MDTGIADEPAVRYFLIGENRWLEADHWPPSHAHPTPVYFRQGTGRTEASLNNGHLTFEAPNTDKQPDTYVYDPDDPVIGHHGSSPTVEIDQREREGRLLTYTSEVLQEPLVVIGPIRTVLYASSSAPDTDWVVRLCNVWPDGRSIRVCDGIVRARFRESLEREVLLQPGDVYEFHVDMAATAQAFLPGHRVRVQVTSSDFPRYDRNLNTGCSLVEGTESRVAVNTIHHDAGRPSQVVLPVIRHLPEGPG